MGGGGFSMNPAGSATALDRHLLELTGKASPLVCFAPTASADAPTYINKFLVAYGALGVRTMVLSLWDGARAAVERLPEADVVFVGGGSTVNMDALWRAHGVDRVLRTMATDTDVVLAGISAGASIWFEACATDSFGPLAPWRGGLGLLPGSFCPHFDGEAERAPAYTGWIADGTLPAGWAVDDGAALHFHDGDLLEAVTERDNAKAYRVFPSDAPTSSGVLMEPQQMRRL